MMLQDGQIETPNNTTIYSPFILPIQCKIYLLKLVFKFEIYLYILQRFRTKPSQIYFKITFIYAHH